MTKADALRDLMHAARNARDASQAEANRIIRACKLLGLSRSEVIEVLGWLDYCNTDGEPYRQIKLNLPRT